jgi:hypothetical protein
MNTILFNVDTRLFSDDELICLHGFGRGQMLLNVQLAWLARDISRSNTTPYISISPGITSSRKIFHHIITALIQHSSMSHNTTIFDRHLRFKFRQLRNKECKIDAAKFAARALETLKTAKIEQEKVDLLRFVRSYKYYLQIVGSSMFENIL